MITLILPYYEQPRMLVEQLAVIREYPEGLQVIVVDDGSPRPAADYIHPSDWPQISLYRIDEDIPWNREEARNLGAYVAESKWIIQADIDHILRPSCARDLLKLRLDPARWYRFPRFRRGRADRTRRKDSIPDGQSYGRIKPHQDSYLITRRMFLSSPYDERYAGCLGGGTPFLRRMTDRYGEPSLLPCGVLNPEPLDIYLEVLTEDVVPDASVQLNRDRTEYAGRRALIADGPPEEILCHPWHRVF